LLLLLLLSLPLLSRWQQSELRRTRSLNNMRRLATGLLLYAQDWDGRMMPPATRLPDGHWLTWAQILDAYVQPSSTFLNPANPPGSTPPRHPKDGYPIKTGYALNRRFWDVFAPGPFPIENLELQEQTVLFVEAGPMWNDPKNPSRASDKALLDYGDTTDRIDGFCPYPSPHNGKMTVVAVDGHADTIEIKHYGPENGPHDPLYGRLGGNFYNWNGGHPNGETDTPPRE
jgi:prepilin-type processing-associated H-X9-DG protein